MRHFAYPLCARSAVKVLHGLPLQTFAMERGVHAALRTLQAAPTPARWWCAWSGTDPASIKRVYAPKANGARLLSALPPASTQQHACATSALSSRGRAFLISGSVGARPPPLRGSGPLD